MACAQLKMIKARGGGERGERDGRARRRLREMLRGGLETNREMEREGRADFSSWDCALLG